MIVSGKEDFVCVGVDVDRCFFNRLINFANNSGPLFFYTLDLPISQNQRFRKAFEVRLRLHSLVFVYINNFGISVVFKSLD